MQRAPLHPPSAPSPGHRRHPGQYLPLIGLLLFLLAIGVLHHALAGHQLHDIRQQLRAIPARRIALAGGLTLLSYLALSLYDRLALRCIGRSLAADRVVLVAFVSYAFSNTLGFSVLTSGSLRYRLYAAWGLSAEEIARILVLTTLTFWLGILSVGGLSFICDPLQLPLAGPFATARPLGLIFLLLLAAYLLFLTLRRRPLVWREWTIPVPTPGQGALQLLVGGIDWLLAGSVLFVLLPPDSGLHLGHFLGIYLLAQTVALISHVPGGLGVFESMILLTAPAIPVPALMGVLLVYRAMYYLGPLLVAASALALYEVASSQGRVQRLRRVAGQWTSAVAPSLLAGLVLLAGAVLLFSGATPAVPQRLLRLRQLLPLPVVELSHFLGSLAGAGLLVLARGLQRRLDAAWGLTAALLAAGAVFSLLKGADYEEALLLSLVLAAVLSCRRHFYRKASLVADRFTPGWLAAILLVLCCSVGLGLFAYKHVIYRHDLWWQFAFSGDAPRFLRATVGAAGVLLVFGGLHLLRPVAAAPGLPDAATLAHARRVLATSPSADANLALLGDKALLFNPAGDAFLMYGVEKRSWVVMGDPVGNPAVFGELLWQFRELCGRAGGWPVFYEVGPEHLPLYLDLGLTLLKVGENGRVPLADFSLAGGHRSGLRYAVRRLEKEGCRFEVVPATEVAGLLPELRRISADWLAAKQTREKGFSLGFFDDAYLCQFPLALVWHQERRVAFANLWCGAQRQELSLDLMRYDSTAPTGVMEYLFVQLLLWGQAQGYGSFLLGMAPLAGLESRPFASLWQRLGGLIYRHSEQFYNFQGLRAYKDKFHPDWEPRYLACPGMLSLPRILLNVAALVSGGFKGILRK